MQIQNHNSRDRISLTKEISDMIEIGIDFIIEIVEEDERTTASYDKMKTQS